MATRKLKLKNGAKKKAETVEARHDRKVEDLLIEATNHDEKTMAKFIADVTEGEILAMIDEAATWDAKQKSLSRMVTAAKSILLQSAKADKWKQKAGKKAAAKIGKSSTTETGTAKEFAQLLKAEGKRELFNDLVKVQIGEAKKVLGIDALEEHDFIKVKTKEYGSVTLKSL